MGSTSSAQTVTVTNTGNANLTFSGAIGVTGPFAIAASGTTCSTSNPLAPSGSCTVAVTFTPTAAGTASGSLSFTDNATGSPPTVSLTGTGTGPAPAASLSPASYTFANQPAATASSPQIFTLSNSGNATLNIASIAITGAFSENTTCGTTLAPNSSCDIAVIFTPAASGSFSASLTVTDNSNGVADSAQSSTLSGTGTHDVFLTWTASPTSGVVGYYVFRGTSAGNESSTALNSSPILFTDLPYVDTNVSGGLKYFYVVTAVGSDGVTQSAPSNEASATPPSP